MSWESCRAVILDELERKGLTTGQLAAKCAGIRRTTVYEAMKTEGGTEPRIGTVLAILAAIGRDMTWLGKSVRAAAA